MSKIISTLLAALLSLGAFNAFSQEQSSAPGYQANTGFVRYMLSTAKVGDQVTSFEWGRITHYTITSKERKGRETLVYLEKRDGGFIMWPHHDDEPPQCGQKDQFCQNAKVPDR